MERGREGDTAPLVFEMGRGREGESLVERSKGRQTGRVVDGGRQSCRQTDRGRQRQSSRLDAELQTRRRREGEAEPQTVGGRGGAAAEDANPMQNCRATLPHREGGRGRCSAAEQSHEGREGEGRCSGGREAEGGRQREDAVAGGSRREAEGGRQREDAVAGGSRREAEGGRQREDAEAGGRQREDAEAGGKKRDRTAGGREEDVPRQEEAAAG